VRVTKKNGGPTLICANVAAVIDETGSASHWYGFFENGVLSSSARCTMQGKFYAFAKRDQKSINQINNALQCPHARNGTKAIVVNAFLSSVSTIVLP
jgi:hypothetical protein